MNTKGNKNGLQARQSAITLAHLRSHRHSSTELLQDRLLQAMQMAGEDEFLAVVGCVTLIRNTLPDREVPDALDNFAERMLFYNGPLSLLCLRTFFELGKQEALNFAS